MIILTGECGCGKSSIEKFLVSEHGYERIIPYTACSNGTAEDQYKENSICVLSPRRMKELKKNLTNKNIGVYTFYIKVPRKDRLIKMFQRGDDIDEAIERDRKDSKIYRFVEKEVDFILNNMNYFNDPENMAYWITDCIERSKLNENY